MPNDIDDCVLTVSADDNAQFYHEAHCSYKSYDTEAIWNHFGEKAVKDMEGEESCATRVSIALSRSGYTLTGAHYTDGSSASNNVVNRGWDATILNADGSSTKRHIIMSAAAMSQFYSSVFGDKGADYDSSLDYNDHSAEAYKPKFGDIVIFGDSGHVGICPGTEPAVGYFMTGQVRLLYRESWGS